MKVNMAFFIFIPMMLSCTVEEMETTTSTRSSLDQYVSNFEQEARNRGLHIDVSALGITIELADIPEQNVAGVCYTHSHAPGRIEIDAPYYHSMPDLRREYVVFHELGHCVLGRAHAEAQYPNGTCRSIMASGTGQCIERYTLSNRSRYLDELFRNL